ncbi:alpha 1,2 mannosyltransferase [Friedmanniomyces endolithicus]|uniref:Mannosyltransferase n=1 Tax=Friedmanniomyces endolithicus TaxID=329885 RepID=A0A4U0VB70_9PEZI|nr:alpha 1,2 mannosyltransferase [Friedmanniomyces endolithicus]KAK0810940.1 alpha 1,2 mannosyltransferase [Friedmanniomyces endolithicus]KAK0840308.1 alpha 1,2 mannosyltransferase [Friedmanniomyces endolithicus]KAK0845198.1 alpha 1,2 mannosyltransferase [Friedmanniomyces endolithicus]KAK0879138.1 alpha 1,2 mannosyltransferase [Friedmanniomyces endolithicus]
MSRRVYLFLVCLRLYFALSPSYIHPDEHFQGPEIIAGEIFDWPSYKTWEFTSDHPIRSIFPLWLIYGPPLTILKWVCGGAGYHVSPMAVFYTLRLFMFLLSFVLQDWALHELLPDKRERSTALLLVASSYVTWTFQMHTFSNSIETIIVLWSLVLMRRMSLDHQHTQIRSCIVLAFLGVLGVFNRITFPAFLLLPGIQLVPHIIKKPLSIAIVLFAAASMTVLAIAIDTEYYTGDRLRLRRIFSTAVVTPWNNLAYNLDSANLAQHGIHPFWQHFVANLPQLIGPAIPLLVISSKKDTLFWAGLTGTALLSCFRHQEPRFLLPAVPLLLASIKWPTRYARLWLCTWVLFNALAAVVFGRYHQAGVVPVQAWLAREENDVSHVFWWKTYSPPRWILGEKNEVVNTTDLMGMPRERMYEQLAASVSCQRDGVDVVGHDRAWLVAPLSSSFLDASAQTSISVSGGSLHFEPVYTYRRHVGLDDLDWAEDGVWGTLQRVVGERGLGVYEFYKVCEE